MLSHTHGDLHPSGFMPCAKTKSETTTEKLNKGQARLVVLVPESKKKKPFSTCDRLKIVTVYKFFKTERRFMTQTDAAGSRRLIRCREVKQRFLFSDDEQMRNRASGLNHRKLHMAAATFVLQTNNLSADQTALILRSDAGDLPTLRFPF